jgi:hypothetical protein
LGVVMSVKDSQNNAAYYDRKPTYASRMAPTGYTPRCIQAVGIFQGGLLKTSVNHLLTRAEFAAHGNQHGSAVRHDKGPTDASETQVTGNITHLPRKVIARKRSRHGATRPRGRALHCSRQRQ